MVVGFTTTCAISASGKVNLTGFNSGYDIRKSKTNK
jgi:hypothetical protein